MFIRPLQQSYAKASKGIMQSGELLTSASQEQLKAQPVPPFTAEKGLTTHVKTKQDASLGSKSQDVSFLPGLVT